MCVCLYVAFANMCMRMRHLNVLLWQRDNSGGGGRVHASALCARECTKTGLKADITSSIVHQQLSCTRITTSSAAYVCCGRWLLHLGWPEHRNVYHTVYDRVYGKFPAKINIYTVYTVYVWFWQPHYHMAIFPPTPTTAGTKLAGAVPAGIWACAGPGFTCAASSMANFALSRDLQCASAKTRECTDTGAGAHSTKHTAHRDNELYTFDYMYRYCVKRCDSTQHFCVQ